MNSYDRIYNILLEAQTPERHAHLIKNKAMAKFEKEREDFKKSGGKVASVNLKGAFDPASPNFQKSSDYDKAYARMQTKGDKAGELRKKRLTTQLTLKDKLSQASKGSARTRRIDRMHATQDKRGGGRPGWRGQDETDVAQRRGQAYPGGPETSNFAPRRKK
tara:strand:+ start:849 stop:1334 length:486 start_codon:yes stop_codon:yes gene_type:complete